MNDLLTAATRGFGLGFGLIVAIGAQNAFVLERGLKRNHVLPVVALCALADAALIAAGVAGLGTAIATLPVLVETVTIGGAVFLYAYAFLALRRAARPGTLAARDGQDLGLKAAMATVLALTFLNPHVYLDTVMLLGSLSARYGAWSERLAYGAGAAAASLVWFVVLGFGARFLAPLFRRPMAWRFLDLTIACVMALLATTLLIGALGIS